MYVLCSTIHLFNRSELDLELRWRHGVRIPPDCSELCSCCRVWGGGTSDLLSPPLHVGKASTHASIHSSLSGAVSTPSPSTPPPPVLTAPPLPGPHIAPSHVRSTSGAPRVGSMSRMTSEVTIFYMLSTLATLDPLRLPPTPPRPTTTPALTRSPSAYQLPPIAGSGKLSVLSGALRPAMARTTAHVPPGCSTSGLQISCAPPPLRRWQDYDMLDPQVPHSDMPFVDIWECPLTELVPHPDIHGAELQQPVETLLMRRQYCGKELVFPRLMEGIGVAKYGVDARHPGVGPNRFPCSLWLDDWD